jgi:hypothetical protein
VDFIVEDESMLEAVQWIVANMPFDRFYFYYPIGPTDELSQMRRRSGGRE